MTWATDSRGLGRIVLRRIVFDRTNVCFISLATALRLLTELPSDVYLISCMLYGQ